MTDQPVDELFRQVADRLLESDPRLEEGRMLHSTGLKIGGKFFGCPMKGELFVKLPEGRVTELIASGAGRPLQPGRGRPMREWVSLRPIDETACEAYLLEARDFVAELPARARRPRT